jgi:hypothetical protein
MELEKTQVVEVVEELEGLEGLAGLLYPDGEAEEGVEI